MGHRLLVGVCFVASAAGFAEVAHACASRITAVTPLRCRCQRPLMYMGESNSATHISEVTDGADRIEGEPYILADSYEPIEVWCDGSYDPETGAGGATAVIMGDDDSGRWLVDVEMNTAGSLSAEWTGAKMALSALQRRVMFSHSRLPLLRPVRVFTASKNVVDSCTERTVNTKEWLPLLRHKESVYQFLDMLEHEYLHMPITFQHADEGVWPRGGQTAAASSDDADADDDDASDASSEPRALVACSSSVDADDADADDDASSADDDISSAVDEASSADDDASSDPLTMTADSSPEDADDADADAASDAFADAAFDASSAAAANDFAEDNGPFDHSFDPVAMSADAYYDHTFDDRYDPRYDPAYGMADAYYSPEYSRW